MGDSRDGTLGLTPAEIVTLQAWTGAVAARKDVTFWKRFMPPLPRLLEGLFQGLLMVH